MTISASDAAADSDRLDRSLELYRDLSVALRGQIAQLKAGTGGRRGRQGRRRGAQVVPAAPCRRFSISRRVLSNEAEHGPAGRAASSTSTRHAPRSLRDLLSGLPKGDLDAFLDALSPNALMSLPWLFEHWALGTSAASRGRLDDLGHPGRPGGRQDPRRGRVGPRAGRRGQAGRPGAVFPGRPGRRDAGPGARGDGVRVLAASSPARRPTGGRSGRPRASGWSGRTARWRRFSRPAIRRALRGPQFDAAWCDEVGKWTKAEDAWDMLQFALRLGDRPRVVVTTTPRRNPLLLGLVEAPGTVVTRAPTAANRMHLAAGFLEAVTAQLRRRLAGAAGARRRVRARRRGRALDLGDARGGAARAGAGDARPGGGGGRPAGDERRGRPTSAGSSWRA